ncbi:hypothetical protein L3X38_023495 [Prunus dulcis]|uniref:GAG-pre-integrase domain-containing protein n=1 Tax=Prunus dulcis TaxID=3755 RepID=A0AAD4VZK7_PRUDU|nr:hypothetical protein L3X38_023495 [Prunus dulcis]
MVMIMLEVYLVDQDLATVKTFFSGKSSNGLYPFLFTPNESFQVLHVRVALLGVRADCSVWHSRLGHPALSTLQFLSSHNKLSSSGSQSSFFCHSCPWAHATPAPNHSPSSDLPIILSGPSLSSCSPRLSVSQPLPSPSSPAPNVPATTTTRASSLVQSIFAITHAAPAPALTSPAVPTDPSCPSHPPANKNHEWLLAVADEFNALLRAETWNLVPHTPTMNVLSNKWFFFVSRGILMALFSVTRLT